MTEEFKLFLIAVASGCVGVCGSFLIKTAQINPGGSSGKLNVHGWYATGILSFLLICAVASDWGSIPELATILSFAVGLASLILSLIAIIQTLTTTGSNTATLNNIETSAKDAVLAGEKLSTSVTAIQEAANNAQSAASAALKAVENFESLSKQIVESNTELRHDIATRVLADHTKSGAVAETHAEVDQFIQRLTMGGATSIYTALQSNKHSKAFNFPDVLSEEDVDWEVGYVYALRDAGLLSFNRENDLLTITALGEVLTSVSGQLKSISFNKKSTNDSYVARLKSIDEFFEETSSSPLKRE
jgi:hypothetical protein